VIQEILGHSVLSTTADIYSHLTHKAFTEAANAMDRALGDLPADLGQDTKSPESN
jgi:site-specific recombinase XerC